MKSFHNLIFATTLLAAANASAANLTWLTTNGTWDLSAANWTGPVAWTQTDATTATNAAIFAGTDGAVGAYTVTAGEPLATQTLTFNNTGYNLYSTGSSKTLTVTTAGNSTSTNFNVAAGKTASVAANTGLQTIIEQATSNLRISGGGTLKLDSGAYVRGGTSGGGILLSNITVDLATGSNLRALSTASGNFLLGYLTGETSVLNINGGTALQNFTGPNGLIVGNLGSGTLNISSTAGSRMLTASPNMLLASGAASSGTVNLDGGLLSVRAITKGSGTATFNFNGGTLNKAGTFAADLLNFTSVVKSGGAVIDTNGTDATISGAMTDGGGGLTKTGTGNLTLTGANTYSGNTTVNAGNLILSNASGVSISGNLVHNTTTGSLVRLGASEQIADTGRFIFMPTAAGRFQLQGFNETIAGLEGSGANTRIVEAAQDNQANSPATLTLNVTGSNAYTYDGYLRDAAGVTTSKLTLIKNGTGTQTFSGQSGFVSYSGATTINDGVLEFSGANSVANNSAITVTGPGTVKFSAAGNRTTAITGTGNLIANATGGTLTLSGANTYNGTTTVTAGVLKAGVASVANTSGAFGNNSAVVLANTAGVALDITGFNTQIGSLTGGGAAGGNVILGSATLSVGGDNTSPAAYAGVISGNGGLTKTGNGILTLASVSTYLGDTNVNGGSLHLADDAGLSFKIGANGVNNSILGTATLLLDGDFLFDLTTAATLVGNSWNIVNVATLNETFGSTFTLASTLGAFTNNSGIWTRDENSVTYQFEQSTGVLSVIPEPSTFALAALGLTSLVLRRRRRQA